MGAWLLAFTAVAVLQLLAGSSMVQPYDEALTLYGASRVAHGALPYRDFWSLYSPGSFYALAALDRAFGESVLIGRAFDAASRSAIVLLVFALASRRPASLAPWAAAGAAFTVLACVREYLFPALPATAFALLAMLALRRALRLSAAASFRGSARGWVAPGVAVGAALLFRHDFGAYALLACMWGLMRASRSAVAGWREQGAAMAFLMGGSALVAAPPMLAMLAAVPFADVYENLIGIPLRVYVDQRALPFPLPGAAWQEAVLKRSPMPMLSLAGVWLPPIVTALAAVAAMLRSRNGAASHWFESLLVLSMFLCLKGSVRVQVLHMLPALMVSFVVLALATHGLRWRSRPRLQGGLVAMALVAIIVLAAQRARTWALDASAGPLILQLGEWRRCVGPQASRLGCFTVRPDHASVLAFLRARARPGDTLYVGAGRHDKLFVNDVDLYFLSGLPAATRWHDLHPGVQTTRSVQAEMIDAMTRHPPAFVVIDTAWDGWSEPNASRSSSGVTLLDAFLHARYVPIYASGTLTVGVPRGEAGQ